MAYITNRQLLEMLFEGSSRRTSFSRYCEDLAETKFKEINVYLHGETGVGKAKLARKKIAKRNFRKRLTKTLKKKVEYN